MKSRLLTFALAAACVLLARAEIDVPTDGSDGDLILSDTGTAREVVIDLGLAPTAAWNTQQKEPLQPEVGGVGIYDPAKWAVVFKYNSVRIGKNVTVRFKNHGSRAPVVWLVKGDVEIAGTVELSGAGGDADPNRIILAEPGPGGFRGGDSQVAGAEPTSGFGPGGSTGVRGGSLQSPSFGSIGYAGGVFSIVSTYGNNSLVPLIGGSGCGGDQRSLTGGGGAGGGAILIAVRSVFNLSESGTIRANGGAVSTGFVGSGGGVRVVCDSAVGSGVISAVGDVYAGNGRIRLECSKYAAGFAFLPPSFPVLPLNPVRLWPEPAAPQASIISVADVIAPADPRANMAAGQPADMVLTPGIVTKLVTIETANMPTNATVTLRVVSTPSGAEVRVNADFLSTTADPTKLLWQKEVTFNPGYHALQVVAVSP